MAGPGEFAAYLAFYPGGCGVRLLDEAQVSNQPLRIFHGTADDQTIIAPCREYVERLRQAGKDVVLIEYPEAYHSFDAQALPPSKFEAEVLSSRNCTSIEQAEGRFAVLHRDTGQPASRAAPCISRGITQGYNPHAHRQAIQDVRAFLSATFKLP